MNADVFMHQRDVLRTYSVP